MSQRSCRTECESVSDQMPVSRRAVGGDERLAKAGEHDWQGCQERNAIFQYLTSVNGSCILKVIV